MAKDEMAKGLTFSKRSWPNLSVVTDLKPTLKNCDSKSNSEDEAAFDEVIDAFDNFNDVNQSILWRTMNQTLHL